MPIGPKGQADGATRVKKPVKSCSLCGRSVTQLTRHYHEVHNLSMDELVKERQKLNLDRKDKKREGETKERRAYLSCPLCNLTVKRLDQHLQRFG